MSSLESAEAAAAVQPAVQQSEQAGKAQETDAKKASYSGAADIEQVTPEQVVDFIEKNGDLQFGGRSINFSYSKDINRVVIKVMSGEAEEEEVVRQIPPEEYINFVSRFREMFGLLMDKNA